MKLEFRLQSYVSLKLEGSFKIVLMPKAWKNNGLPK